MIGPRNGRGDDVMDGAHHTRYGIAKIDLARSHVQVAPRASKAISLVVAGTFRAAIRATTGL